ncbi:MAG: hypothetical protein AAGU23_04705 [Bacillota bacterium]
MAKFACSDCGRTSSVSANCCGKPMIAGDFQCKTCGRVASTADPCCGKVMCKL